MNGGKTHDILTENIVHNNLEKLKILGHDLGSLVCIQEEFKKK
jgi:hypothetical protein